MADNGPPRIVYCMDNYASCCEMAFEASPSETLGSSVSPATYRVTDTTNVRYDRMLTFGSMKLSHLWKYGSRTFLILIIPILFLRRLSRGRWSLLTLLMAPLVTGLVWLGLRIPDASHAYQREISLEWFNFINSLTSLFAVVPLFILVVVAMRVIRQRKWASLLFLTLLMTFAIVAIIVADMYMWGYFSDPFPLRVRWIPWLPLILISSMLAGGLLAIGMAIQMSINRMANLGVKNARKA
ncbi:MAG: hypothetical protein AAF497_11645 [Planctomycetota bacterium]